MADCSFCGNTIEKGTGVMFVRKDGKILWFCGTKCEKNTNKLKRIPRETKWTKEAQAAKQSAAKSKSDKHAEKAAEKPKAKGAKK